MTIKENLTIIREKVIDSAVKAGRNPDEIKLMAVSKTRTSNEVMEAYNAGHRLFGENRVKEGSEKFLNLPTDIDLHLIGHLQRNKAKEAAAAYSWVESIDKAETAFELNKHCLKNDSVMNILLEMNTSGEDSKNGFRSEEELKKALERIVKECESLVFHGLMTIAPFTADEKQVRRAFSSLYNLYTSIKAEYSDLPVDTLSMGMSSDFTLAIQEGSTLVRVGTAIFGERK